MHNDPHATVDAHTDTGDDLLHHHSNPFLDPQTTSPGLTASGAQQTADRSTAKPPPADSPSHRQSSHFNPFQDSPDTAAGQGRSEHAAPAAPQHQEPSLSKGYSDLPPFTLADLSATTSDMAAFSTQQSSTETRPVSNAAAHSVGFNPFLDGATEHISPTPVAASVEMAASHSERQSEANSHGSADVADLGPSPPAQGSTTRQPAGSWHRPEGQASAAENQSDAFIERSTSANVSHADVFDRHNVVPHQPPEASDPATAAQSDRQPPADSSQADAKDDFADFHDTLSSASDSMSVQQGQASQHVQSSAAAGGGEVFDGGNGFADFGDVPSFTINSASAQQSQAPAQSSTAPEDSDGVADFPEVLTPAVDSTSAQRSQASQHAPAQSPAAPDSAAAFDEDDFADFEHVPPPTANSTSAQQRQASQHAPAQSSAAADSVAALDEDGFADFDSAPAPAADDTSANQTAEAIPVLNAGVKQNEEEQVKAESSSEASQPTQPQHAASVNRDSSASDDFASFNGDQFLRGYDSQLQDETAASASAAQPHQSLADDQGKAADHGLAHDADMSAPATASTSLEIALPSQAALDQELTHDCLADAADVAEPAILSTSIVKSALPSRATHDQEAANDSFTGVAEPAARSTSALKDALPSQASLEAELADGVFVDAVRASEPATNMAGMLVSTCTVPMDRAFCPCDSCTDADLDHATTTLCSRCGHHSVAPLSGKVAAGLVGTTQQRCMACYFTT